MNFSGGLADVLSTVSACSPAGLITSSGGISGISGRRTTPRKSAQRWAQTVLDWRMAGPFTGTARYF